MFRIDRNNVHITKLEGGIINRVEIVEPEPDQSGGDAAREPEPAKIDTVAILKDYKQKGELLISEAYQQAEKIKDDAAMEAEVLKAQAWKKAYEEGYREGIEAAADEARAQAAKVEEQLETGAQMVRNVIREFEAARDELFSGLEDEVVTLSLQMAKKILNISLENDERAFESMIKKALQQMKYEGKITIRVSKAEYERFFSEGSATFVLGDESIFATIVEDSLMNSGDCVIESEGETINAGIDSQMNLITLAFRQSDGNE